MNQNQPGRRPMTPLEHEFNRPEIRSAMERSILETSRRIRSEADLSSGGTRLTQVGIEEDMLQNHVQIQLGDLVVPCTLHVSVGIGLRHSTIIGVHGSEFVEVTQALEALARQIAFELEMKFAQAMRDDFARVQPIAEQIVDPIATPEFGEYERRLAAQPEISSSGTPPPDYRLSIEEQAAHSYLETPPREEPRMDTIVYNEFHTTQDDANMIRF